MGAIITILAKREEIRAVKDFKGWVAEIWVPIYNCYVPISSSPKFRTAREACNWGINWSNKMQLTTTQQDQIEDRLREILPSGSGIDCKWQFEWQQNGAAIICTNAFHCMDENGFYCGYADFKLKLPQKCAAVNFKLSFTGDFSRRSAAKYCLREYLEDTFYHALTEHLTSNQSLLALTE